MGMAAGGEAFSAAEALSPLSSPDSSGGVALRRGRCRWHSSESVDNREPHVGECELWLVVENPALILVLLGHHASHDAVAKVPERTLGSNSVRLAILVRGACSLDVALKHEVRRVVLQDVEHSGIGSGVNRLALRHQLEQLRHLVRSRHTQSVLHRAVHRDARAAEETLRMNAGVLESE